jgi:hypothetical protein
MTLDYVTVSGNLIETILVSSQEGDLSINLIVCQLLLMVGGMRQAVTLDKDVLAEANPIELMRLRTAVKAADDLLSHACQDITSRD